jgi:molecular chaperone GrpE
VSQQDTTKAANEDTEQPDTVPEEAVDSADTQAATEDTTAQEQEKTTTPPALEKQAKEYLEGWQRERSEFANYKRRMEREMKELAANAAAGAFLSLLPIIDDFDRAFSTIPTDLQGNAWMDGVSGIHRKFQKILEDQGITVIDPVGEVFDPTQHEAVGTENSDTVESGHVTATLQKGYLRGDRVLRPALVRVAN